MVDFDILNECGTTNARLREFFTAEMPTTRQQGVMMKTPEGRKKLKQIKKDVDARQQYETKIAGWLQEHIQYSLTNYKRLAAVDLAWDSVPINKMNLPLIQYAQGRIDVTQAAKTLSSVPDGNNYVRKNASGEAVAIDMPKFLEMNVNLVRSVLTRRVAAQAVKYDSLWPFFKLEPRDTTQVGRLRGDLASQRIDIMSDQYGYRHFQTQAVRDMFLYTECFAFPRSSWEREVQWQKQSFDPAFRTEKDAQGKIKKTARVVKEGIPWVNPHRSRVFYDNAFPPTSLNTDTGCTYTGFWDVDRWGNIKNNPDYFNVDAIRFSTNTVSWLTQYAAYFNQYFDTITPPQFPQDPSGNNDRKNNVGVYQVGDDDVGVFFSHVWVKETPKALGWGDYPYPVWVHLKVAGEGTVVYADIMPSSAAAVFSYNANDGRLDNISLAMELMQYQDILTNLHTQLLETIRADLFSIGILNRDIFPDTEEGNKVFKEFKDVMSGKAELTSMQVLEASFDKLSQILGREITADMVFKVVRSTPNTGITALFESITRVISMAERLMVLSAHEQGQAASHEISATESSQIAGSTDTIYSFISSAVDEGRAAMKRICFESLIACGQKEIVLPVTNRYPDAVIQKAGFKVKERDDDSPIGYVTVMGDKYSLVHDYLFSSRDGGNRASNSQSAQVLTQLVTPLFTSNPAAQQAILSAMGKEKLFEIMNTIFRLADAGVDLKLELKPGDSDELLIEEDKQVMAMLQQLSEAVKQDTTDVQQIKSILMQLGVRPPMQPQPAPGPV